MFLGWERIGLARSMGGEAPSAGQDNNFTVAGSQAVTGADLRVGELMAICLSENDRRFAGYDVRLLRPTTVPRLARLFVRLSRFFGAAHGAEAQPSPSGKAKP